MGSPWSQNTGQQRRRFTTYERDGNEHDEAMFRRYNHWMPGFIQPDPYDGSYDLAEPKSFNRYTYVKNDPVNFVDPTGLDECEDAHGNKIPCGPDPEIDPSDIHRIYTTAPLLGPYFLPASQSGRRPEIISLIPAAPTTPAFRRLFPGPEFMTRTREEEIERRLAEGRAWDRWYEWVKCNTPIKQKYDRKLDEFHNQAQWLEIGTGIAIGTGISTALPEDVPMEGGRVGAGWIGFLSIVGVIAWERDQVATILSDYSQEAASKCGPKPPHP
jgi:RHS repeat-associated protein